MVLWAPSNYPIWGFFYEPYLSDNWSNNLLSEIIPYGSSGFVKLPPGEWDWQVTTSNNAPYYWSVKKPFYGYSVIRVPELYEIKKGTYLP